MNLEPGEIAVVSFLAAVSIPIRDLMNLELEGIVQDCKNLKFQSLLGI